MAAKLEIEIVDRSPSPQPGQPSPGQPVSAPGQPVSEQQPPGSGQSQFPPGSAGDIAARWAAMGALSAPAGSMGGNVGVPAPTQIPQGAAAQALLDQVETPAVVKQDRAETGREVAGRHARVPWSGEADRELTGRHARVPWSGEVDRTPAGLEDARRGLFGWSFDREEPVGPARASAGQEEAGLQRLLWQGGLGQVGNVMAMVDQHRANLASGAGGMQLAASGMGVAGSVSSLAGSGLDAVSQGVRQAGSYAADIVRNDPSVVGKVVDGMEGLARKIPVVGEALGGALGLIVAPARAVADVFNAMTERGRQLAGYSPELAMATAMQEVEYLLADIREAQDFGGDYAKMIEMETQFNIQWREAMIPIKKMICEYLVQFVEWLKPYIQNLPQAVEGVGTAMSTVWETSAKPILTGFIPHFAALRDIQLLMGNVAGATAETARNTRREPTPDELMANLYTFLESGQESDIAPAARPEEFGQAVGGANILGGV